MNKYTEPQMNATAKEMPDNFRFSDSQSALANEISALHWYLTDFFLSLRTKVDKFTIERQQPFNDLLKFWLRFFFRWCYTNQHRQSIYWYLASELTSWHQWLDVSCYDILTIPAVLIQATLKYPISADAYLFCIIFFPLQYFITYFSSNLI